VFEAGYASVGGQLVEEFAEVSEVMQSTIVPGVNKYSDL
jgi:hypothetical protein